MNQTVEGKTHKNGSFKVFLKYLLLLLLIFLVSVISFIVVLDKKMSEDIDLKKPYLLTIENGTSFQSLSRQFVDLKWIKTRFWLRSYGRLFPDDVSIKAGTYQVLPHTTLKLLLEQVVSGKEHMFSITFVEGSTFKECLTVLSLDPRIKHTLSNKSVSDISSLLGLAHENPEGLLFPDTYAFRNGTSDIDILKRASNKLEKELSTLWLKRAVDLPYESAYEALIMASIIEKETGFVPEQPLISSVFINRLAKKMRLQTDPTIIYGLGDRYTGDITRANMREKTAYNTYRINGLPPTPISLAGASAIEAALNPSTSDYFYFVSQGNGQHTFSKTLKEHNKAVKAFLALPQK